MTDTKVNVSVQANVISHKEKIKPGATFQKANCIDKGRVGHDIQDRSKKLCPDGDGAL